MVVTGVGFPSQIITLTTRFDDQLPIPCIPQTLTARPFGAAMIPAQDMLGLGMAPVGQPQIVVGFAVQE
ncbi:hypothetical protein A1507_22730 [Methylomonas koyamae]|uniref:Uncharacterized protein n=1 Tax=Methylomonas koyamae TaxID=702114 RepID=A0A177NRE5_9GAMM|nr:hypothetical protein A1507_22730 [Methylomonas koyamae]